MVVRGPLYRTNGRAGTKCQPAPRSLWIYTGYALLLVLAMGFAAVVHEVPDWFVPLLVVTMLYPAVLYYAFWQVRQITQLRERAQRMQSLTELAGNVAHDFNNVLMGISGHAELAELSLPKDHPARRSLGEVIQGTDRASLLCGQLLAFSGRGVTHRQPLDLAQEPGLSSNSCAPWFPQARLSN